MLTSKKSMSEIHLKQPGFIYSVCRTFTKNKGRTQKSTETRDLIYIYQNKLGKVCFQYDITYDDFKDLTRRTASNKVLHDKTFDIDKNPKYDRYWR